MLGNMSFEEEIEFWRKAKKEYEMSIHPDCYDKDGNRIYKYPAKETQQEYARKHYDKPGTLEDDEALILYIIVMLGGSIFVDRWIIWIVATFIYFKFKNRHK